MEEAKALYCAKSAFSAAEIGGIGTFQKIENARLKWIVAPAS